MGGTIKTNNGVILSSSAIKKTISSSSSDFYSRYGVSDTDLLFWFDSNSSNNTVSYWEDLSGNGYHANQSTASAQPALTNVTYGNVYSFDGVDDHMIISADPGLEITGDLTILAWMHITNDSNEHYPAFYKGSRWVSYGMDLGKSTGSEADEYVIRSSSPKHDTEDTVSSYEDTWAHIGFTFNDNNDELKKYKNGSQRGSTYTVTSNISNSNENIYIAMDPQHTSSNIMSGYMAQIIVFNRELSSIEISSIYTADSGDF